MAVRDLILISNFPSPLVPKAPSCPLMWIPTPGSVSPVASFTTPVTINFSAWTSLPGAEVSATSARRGVLPSIRVAQRADRASAKWAVSLSEWVISLLRW